MPRRSPLDFDISVSADKRRRARERGMTGRVAAGEKRCEWPGCTKAGEYRAPVSPNELNNYRWFCLDHVRSYNQQWNFFEGRSEDQMQDQWRQDMTWERPTWPLGKGPISGAHMGGVGEGNAWQRMGFSDPTDVLGENATINPGRAPDEPRKPRLPFSREERSALDVLGLPPETSSRREVRTRYRELIKDLHPDMNGGDRDQERRLERVIRAWDILRNCRHLKD